MKNRYIQGEISVKAKPFLRWAGGKNWLSRQIEEFLPINGFNQYHEPFLGAGSIFFKLQPSKSHLSDLNSELIETFQQIQTNVESVIKYLRTYQNTEEYYYKSRSKNLRAPASKAARFIYLNQTSYNGIYRVNLNGQYNVPYGFRKKDFFDPENLRQASLALKKVHLKHCDFNETISRVKKGDLVFLDPPYTVTHNNNGFIKYNSRLFDENSQIRLSEYIDNLIEKEAYYILTNAAHDWIKTIFKKPNNKIITLSRTSSIGGTSAKRGKFKELIFTNIKF